jgi:hypothetical protein
MPEEAPVRRGLSVPDTRSSPAERGRPGRTPGGDYKVQTDSSMTIKRSGGSVRRSTLDGWQGVQLDDHPLAAGIECGVDIGREAC